MELVMPRYRISIDVQTPAMSSLFSGLLINVIVAALHRFTSEPSYRFSLLRSSVKEIKR